MLSKNKTHLNSKKKKKRVWTVLWDSMDTWPQSGTPVCDGEWGVTEESRILSEGDERAGHSSYENTQSEIMYQEQESIN